MGRRRLPWGCAVLAALAVPLAARPFVLWHGLHGRTPRAVGRAAVAERVQAAEADGASRALLEELEALAEAGDAAAQFRLGKALRKGKGVPRDPERAFELIKKAADQDLVKAQALVGFMFAKGDGCDMDEQEALDYLTMAGEQGHSNAAYGAGVLHWEGTGFEDEEQDIVGAAYWWKRAATAGHAEASFRLANLLMDEDSGITRNDTAAALLFEQAAEEGHEGAQEALAMMCLRGVGVKQDIDSALELFEMSAENGNAESAYVLGSLLRQGSGTAKDPAAAVKWLTMAGDGGHAKAASELGIMFLTGEGAPMDEEGAAYWFGRAEELEAKSRPTRPSQDPQRVKLRPIIPRG